MSLKFALKYRCLVDESQVCMPEGLRLIRLFYLRFYNVIHRIQESAERRFLRSGIDEFSVKMSLMRFGLSSPTEAWSWRAVCIWYDRRPAASKIHAKSEWHDLVFHERPLDVLPRTWLATMVLWLQPVTQLGTHSSNQCRIKQTATGDAALPVS